MKADAKGALELDKDTQASKKFNLYLFSFFCLLFFPFIGCVLKKKKRKTEREREK